MATEFTLSRSFIFLCSFFCRVEPVVLVFDLLVMESQPNSKLKATGRATFPASIFRSRKIAFAIVPGFQFVNQLEFGLKALPASSNQFRSENIVDFTTSMFNLKSTLNRMVGGIKTANLRLFKL